MVIYGSKKYVYNIILHIVVANIIPKHVLEGSVIAEIFFSDVQYFLNKYRKLTLPIYIEESLMLRYNIKYWSMVTVAATLAKKGEAFIEATEIVEMKTRKISS